ncbi:hypothetical protein BBJ28_00021053 [Nothophytophthora sp. Chile5]|nr:hypothetical protein BBJ28_00021053 [Nothophytophthora sp. Chile5]
MDVVTPTQLENKIRQVRLVHKGETVAAASNPLSVFSAGAGRCAGAGGRSVGRLREQIQSGGGARWLRRCVGGLAGWLVAFEERGRWELTSASLPSPGQSLLERQRRVNDCLKEEMTRIHALQMKTWTPAQYEQKTQQKLPTAAANSQSSGEN